MFYIKYNNKACLELIVNANYRLYNIPTSRKYSL